MNRIPRASTWSVLALVVLGAPLVAQHRLELKGGSDEICLKCHEAIEARLELSIPHAPAVDDECFLCHSPHASRYEKMLKQRERSLCFLCHQDQRLAFQTGEVHTPVREGDCGSCHDPHGSDVAGLLVEEGTDLCLSCHDEMKARMDMRTTHSPFVDAECSYCHDPHNSEHASQLRAPPNRMCALCHNDQEALTAGHRKISVQDTACNGCHDAHASPHSELLLDIVHEPVNQGACRDCHLVDSSLPRALVALGQRLCSRCHENYPLQGDTVVHRPVADGNCGACHEPHASVSEGLLTAAPRKLCEGCHEQVAERFEQSPYQHPLPEDQDACLMCHRPHSSGGKGLLKGVAIRLCLDCHPSQRHGHPMGGEIDDPRTGQPMTCVSCHDPHASSFPMILIGNQNRGLCLECHLQTPDEEEGRRDGRRDR